MKKLKVFGGVTVNRKVFPECRQVRTIVAAYTKKQAIALLDITPHHFNGWWAQTNNAIEIATATEVGVWSSPLDGKVFVRTK